MDSQILINYLDHESKDPYFTSLEISSQPMLWQQTWSCIQNYKSRLIDFLKKLYKQNNLNIILTGAGTSAFIGDTLQGPFQKHTGIPTRSISSTDLVTHPDLFIQKERPTLLISFARSGDSPESLAVVNLVHKLCNADYHLIITCNPEGKLALESNHSNQIVILLPVETNDKGLAMTSSFSSMLLCGALISRIHQLDELEPQISRLISYGENILKNYTKKLQQVANMDFNRAVFLGSGPLFGIATESHLKLQELTQGKIICKHDSYLGVRHGPKAVIDKNTIVVYLFSNNKYVEKFEDDLVREICAQELGMYTIGIHEKRKEDYFLNLNIKIGNDEIYLDEEFLSVCYILPAQILGYYKSLEIGLNPDNPSESGVISRVVQGVTIYDYNN
jgi:tagatose-6-phosphate ketose/aldose isomerase